MKAVIMAAGLSTRMFPLTKDCPKPMLLINGKPMIEYVIKKLVDQGIIDIIITLHYKSKVIVEYLGNGSIYGANIEYVYEEELLGTAGSIKRLEIELNDNFLLCSGSYLLDSIDFKSVLKLHKLKKAIGTIVMGFETDNSFLGFYGQGIMDNGGRLIKFQEKPKVNFSNWVHTTYQIYSPDIFEYIPKGVYCSLTEEILPDILNHRFVQGYKYEGKFWGISTYELYNRTKEYYKVVSTEL